MIAHAKNHAKHNVNEENHARMVLTLKYDHLSQPTARIEKPRADASKYDYEWISADESKMDGTIHSIWYSKNGCKKRMQTFMHTIDMFVGLLAANPIDFG